VACYSLIVSYSNMPNNFNISDNEAAKLLGFYVLLNSCLQRL